MESALRTALIDWLRTDPELSGRLNAVVEEGPSPAPAPTLAIAASASADWSNKSMAGREVRLALELVTRGDQPDEAASIAARIEQRLATLGPQQAGFRLVVTQFLRSRAERRARSLRAALLEYRFLVLASP